MFGLIRFILSLIGFVVVVLVLIFFNRGGIATSAVQTAVKNLSGYVLLSGRGSLQISHPAQFSLGRCVLLNKLGFPKPDFIIFESIQITFKDSHLAYGLNIKNLVLDINQITVTRDTDGKLNFKLPSQENITSSNFFVEHLTLRIKFVMYYDYTKGETPVPIFFPLNHTSNINNINSINTLTHHILSTAHELVENYSPSHNH